MLSRLGKMARRLTSAVCIAALALSLSGASVPAIAQSGKVLPVTPELTLNVRGFDSIYYMGKHGIEPSFQTLVHFFSGLRTGLMTVSASFVAKGEKRLFCIPPDAEVSELMDATYEELQRDRAYWDARKDDSVVPLALQAFARTWPCK